MIEKIRVLYKDSHQSHALATLFLKEIGMKFVRNLDHFCDAFLSNFQTQPQNHVLEG